MINKLKLLKHRGIQTILVLLLYSLTAHLLPYKTHQGFYTISLFIKDMLVLIMPITVGFFISYTVSTFEHKALVFILSIILFETCSNFISVWYAYASAQTVSGNLYSFDSSQFNTSFGALWRIPKFMPAWWSADKGCFAGVALGLINAFYKNKMLNSVLLKGKMCMQFILTKIFARLIPLFILGFAAQMYQSKILMHVIINYTTLVLWLILFLSIYILGLFSFGVKGSLGKIISNIKNLLPAGALSLTSGCSLSTMPWTIEGTRKNLKDPELADAVIPATTNIQQIGDAIAQAFLCFLIYKHFNGYAPSLTTWLGFSIVFVLARFATAAVLGGAIFIMIPIYETYLGFNSEMVAIILALNVVLDPIITSSNVMANGALCIIFEKVFARVQKLTFYRSCKKIGPAE